MTEPLPIVAVNKFTMLDFPGKIAAILFTSGCNLRCGYCHNPDFVLSSKVKQLNSHLIPFEAIKNFLTERKGFLDGVVISGGEPTLHAGLLPFLKKIREIGLLIKLDTNGYNPEMLKKLFHEKLLDYVAMDLKTDFSQYHRVSPGTDNTKQIEESKQVIMDSGLPYEFRTTVWPEHHTLDLLQTMGEKIQGAQRWALQRFRPDRVLNPEFEKISSFAPLELTKFHEPLKGYVDYLEIRE